MIENVAKVCHEANKAYCETLGDTSQPSWEDAPQWQRDSAVDGVKNIIDGITKTPEDSHKGWLSQKESDGWVYGETKDPEKETHPCMVPYDELPKEQQAKDALFFAIAQALI